jgi:hypothetical protein
MVYRIRIFTLNATAGFPSERAHGRGFDDVPERPLHGGIRLTAGFMRI